MSNPPVVPPPARPSGASSTPSHHRGPHDVAITIDNDHDHHHHNSVLYNRFRHASERDVDFDHDVLHRGVRDAGRWAYGTIYVEVWVWNEHKTRLFRPPGGWWLDPVFHQQQHARLEQNVDGQQTTSGTTTTELSHREDCPLCQLTDPTLKTYVPALPLSIGEGLPGVLWAELEGAATSTSTERPSNSGASSRRRASIRDLRVPPQERPLVWRQVQSIANDPDQPFNPRLQLIAAQQTASQVGWAAAVKFNDAHGGLVMYFARSNISLERLRYPTNERYLRQSAAFIGSAYALRQPRQACIALRKEEMHAAVSHVKEKIREIGREALAAKLMKPTTSKRPTTAGTTTTIHPEHPPETTTTSTTTTCQDNRAWHFVSHHWTRILRKLQGGNAQPPPGFGWTQTAWTFTGVFLTLLMLTRTNVWIKEMWGDDKVIVLGPFGALMTLMYGLTQAPASQPRNALLGQTLSMAIAIGVSEIPDMPSWIKQSLATALAVTVMVKLGITHPPAGAAALLFATGNFGWYNFLACLIGNGLAVGAATLINDFNMDRQYPTYWGISDYKEKVQSTLFRYSKVDSSDEQETTKKEVEMPEMKKA
ncbi:Transmembrane protein DDB [Seminavis robusta]|uniref:Transmembrane protein DDB n=1 Tax=Seminavis robusta TaxID=568900 RepID=A0A9N8DGB1_9STRA|nr:Transmembrane protein DDB [Seminavis robusta]|eukprot:Sro105_g053180.1 Transmembrane protein DDB (593) ;mRNA; f:36216-37994